MSRQQETATSNPNEPDFCCLRLYSTQPDYVISKLGPLKARTRTIGDVIIQRNLMHPFIQFMFCTLRSSHKPAILKNQDTIISFCELIPLIGSNGLTSALRSCIVHFLRYLTTLPTGDTSEYELIIQAHDIFIRTVDLTKLDDDSLITLAVQLKLITRYEKVEPLVIKVLEYLIVENSRKLGPRLLDLHFTQGAKGVCDQINQALDSARQTYGREDDPIARIGRFSAMSVRVDEGLIKYFIISLLHVHLIDNIEKAFNNGRVETWACRVINDLLINAKTADDLVQIEIAKCLGLFGAIDSARFTEFPGSAVARQTKVYLADTTSDEFKSALIKDIVAKALSLSSSSAQVTYQCSLKNVFTALELREKDRSFLSLSDDERCLIRAALASPYRVSPLDLRPGPKTFPLFKANELYSNWIRTWVDEMISDFKPTRGVGNLFISLRAIFIQDLSFLEEMLPCLIYNYLASQDIADERKKQLISVEIQEVVASGLPHGQYLSTFDISSAVATHVSVTANVLTQTQLMAFQRIFCLFDSLTCWFQSKLDKSKNDYIFDLLFGSIDKCSMAYLAYACKAYTRSLKYLEEYRHHSPDGSLSLVYSTLIQQIYLALDDPDGAIGARGNKCITDLRQKILDHEANNTNEDALPCCSKALDTHPNSLEYHKKAIRCLISLEQLPLAMMTARGAIMSKPDWRDKITPYMTTCAWQLSQWNALGDLIKSSSHITIEKSNMSLNISRLINAAVTSNGDAFTELLKSITVKAMRPIAVAVSEKLPYEHCYPHLVRIQELNEIRMACSVLHGFCEEVDFAELRADKLREFWSERNNYLQPNLKVLGVILTLQRALFSLSRADKEKYKMDIAKCWLKTAKLARKLGHKQRAYGCFLNLEEMIPSVSHDLQFVASYFTEKAKYVYSAGGDLARDSAIRILEDGVKEYFSVTRLPQDGADETSSAEKRRCLDRRQATVKVLLLRTKFYEESGLQSTSNIISMYSKLMDDVSRSEKGAIQIAKLYDSLCIYDKEAGSKNNCDYMQQAISYYCMALRLGSKHIYEALPRLLQIWFDLGSVLSHYDKYRSKRGQTGRPSDRSRDFIRNVKDIQETFDTATKDVESLKTTVATAILYTALPQMLTRLDHSNKKVQSTLKSLVLTVLKRYPQQAFWHLYANLLNKSSESLVNVCHEIVDKARKEDGERERLYSVMLTGANSFLTLINAQVPPKQRKLSMSSLESVTLQKFLKLNQNIILMPCHKFLAASVVSKTSGDCSPSVFSNCVTIHSVSDQVVIFESLAKPKQFTLRGSDGKMYPFLAKPGDDLRRDSRTVEYLELFNRLMLKDPETRRRNLKITVFAVIPLGERSGLIEFIEGLTDIRSILIDRYSEEKFNNDPQKRSLWLKMIKDKHPAKEGQTDQAALRNVVAYREYMNHYCKPPVFWNWFNQKYTHPSEWHAAKLLFTRSLAVMSIVGYIIGLGDRHLENILIEGATGRIVHVDYNCIFNRGETLAIPERVPFRLTHNLIDAMGNICFEGHFKRTCEEVLRLARSNAAPIMSVLKAFAFDPIVGARIRAIKTQQQSRYNKLGVGDISKINEELPCSDKVSVADIVEKIEFCNEEASLSIKLIDERLKGIHRETFSSETHGQSRPLSVKGHVNALINEATDEHRLSRMFVGWAPFL